MIHQITLSDEDVITMDDTTGNIVIPVNKIPEYEQRKVKDQINVKYVEDADNISHEYFIKDFDIDNNTVELEWIQQINESLLTEAPLSKKIQKNLKKVDRADAKQHKKILKDAKKLLARDMSGEAKNWKFYLANENNKFSPAIDFSKARNIYASIGDDITPEVANAIVTTDTGFIVRRGLEDLYRKGVRLTKETGKVKDEYMLPWESSEPFTTEEESSEDTEASVVDTTTDEAETNNMTDTASDTQDTPSETESTDADATTDDNTQDPAVDGRVAQNKGITKPIIDKFRKIAMATGLEVRDAFDKPVNMSVATEVGKITPETLADYVIKIKGKDYQLMDWLVHAVKNKVITESCDESLVTLDNLLIEAPVIKLSDKDLVDPSSINLSDKVSQALEDEKQRAASKARMEAEKKLRAKYEPVIEKLSTSIENKDSVEDILTMLFDQLVPQSGPADSLAGELLRAIMRMMYRDYNDGDKFFEGYGISTCGSSAEFLFDNMFSEEIQRMLDRAHLLSEDDDRYTDALERLGQHIIDKIRETPSLLWTINTEDSRNYSTKYIEENQPRYEFECSASDPVVELVESGKLDSWDLNRYAESQLEFEPVFEGATVARPWGYSDTSVTIENLTKDGYERLKDSFNRDSDAWWEELVLEHSDSQTDSEYDDEYSEDGSYELE